MLWRQGRAVFGTVGAKDSTAAPERIKKINTGSNAFWKKLIITFTKFVALPVKLTIVKHAQTDNFFEVKYVHTTNN